MAIHRVRFHARGGQGAVTAAKVIAPAIYAEGRNVQAVPAFGVERRGAPVNAFVKYTDELDEVIPTRTYVHEPDTVLCLDDSLIETEMITEGLMPDGTVVINTNRPADELGIDAPRLATVDAGSIARSTIDANIVNTVILGSFAAVTGHVSIENVAEAIRERFPDDLHEGNVEAARQGFEETVVTTVADPA
ncbi:MAG: 2-oxoacid:acceptor oxidoreductase family protein [Halobacteriales archaeon]